jgi:hypothetical protein
MKGIFHKTNIQLFQSWKVMVSGSPPVSLGVIHIALFQSVLPDEVQFHTNMELFTLHSFRVFRLKKFNSTSTLVYSHYTLSEFSD